MSVIHQVRRVIAIMKAEGRSPAAIIANPEGYRTIEEGAGDLRMTSDPGLDGVRTLHLFGVPIYPQTGVEGFRIFAAERDLERTLGRMFLRATLYDKEGKREEIASPNPSYNFFDLLR